MKKRFKKVYIEITNICNLNCSFCPETKRSKQMMDINDFKRIINQVCKYTDYVYLHVKGEPLLHPNLDQMLDICNQYNLHINITTNGRLISDRVFLLKEKNIRQLNVSLHSFSNINDIKNVIEVLRNIKEFYISYRLWNTNAENMNGQIISLLHDVYGNFSNDKINDNTFISFDKRFEWPDLNNSICNSKGRCLALKDQIAILVDGTVVPCCLDNEGDIILGNIFNESLDSILKKERVKIMLEGFKKGILVEELCKHCGYNERFETNNK